VSGGRTPRSRSPVTGLPKCRSLEADPVLATGEAGSVGSTRVRACLAAGSHVAVLGFLPGERPESQYNRTAWLCFRGVRYRPRKGQAKAQVRPAEKRDRWRAPVSKTLQTRSVFKVRSPAFPGVWFRLLSGEQDGSVWDRLVLPETEVRPETPDRLDLPREQLGSWSQKRLGPPGLWTGCTGDTEGVCLLRRRGHTGEWEPSSPGPQPASLRIWKGVGL